MATMFQPWLLFFIFLLTTSLPFSSSQISPQNIETSFPSSSTSVVNTPTSPLSPTTNSNVSPTTPIQVSRKSSDTSSIVKAVVATAATTFVLAGLFFFLFNKYVIARRRSSEQETVVSVSSPGDSNEFMKRFDGTLKGLVVDEKGLDVLYWRKHESGKFITSFRKEVFKRPSGDEGKSFSKRERRTEATAMQEMPLLRGKSSSSSAQVRPQVEDKDQFIDFSRPWTSGIVQEEKAVKSVAQVVPLVSPAPAAASPPPPPPPPPPVPVKKNPAPPPPPIPIKKTPAPPPQPPQIGAFASISRPPTAPKSKSSGSRSIESSSTGNLTARTGVQTKLKPLHWDKVTANADHSMVWDKISDGSFRFDDDLMEALFGYVATNRKSPDKEKNASKTSLGSSNPGSPAQRFILDPRKSQNIAIVLRSLAITRQEILDALLEGQGLNVDTIEKLARIAPTKEEENEILEFDGNPTKLADAESFLYHILKAVPSPFARISAMLFQSNYDAESLHLKESLQTLELGCKELRTRGLFLKLLEAVLKAGNRMNAGTARGNAEAFNLSALKKLSDVKSTDGKTTLLHFVVEEVVRSEGKPCVINRNYSLGRNKSSRGNKSSMTSDNTTSREEKEKEYMMLGLPVVGGLSVDFSNVKKAASIDYDSFVNMCSVLSARVNEIRQLLADKNDGRGVGFVTEMKSFLESAEEELKVVKEEQIRVMELVKRTTEYYQAGASKDKTAHPLQLFVTIKDFLGMVDQACIDIARNQQKKKNTTLKVGSSSPPPSGAGTRFPNLPAHFMSDKSSSDSDDGF